jgi:hypothetical protein
MRGHWAYLVGSGLGLAMLALIAGLQVRTVAASPQFGAQDAARDATIAVNRALKGDRLMPLPTGGTDRQGLQAPRANPKLPDGCEAAVSQMTRSSLAQTPGRCIS